MTTNIIPKISVVMITYNHEKFIAQAVESVLMQQTEFDYELIIGEDCSTDRTREIIIDYQKKYPDKIRLLLHEENLGGPIPGKFNFVQTLGTAKGQYIAILEGDDYWTSPCKLQKQVEFMENHLEYSICFSNAMLFYEDSKKKPHEFNSLGHREKSTIEDLIVGNFMQACTVMFRRGLFEELPAWFYEVVTGDWAIHLLNSHHGYIGYIDEVMATYRVHCGGVWSGQQRIVQLEDAIKLYKNFDKHYDFNYTNLVKASIMNISLELMLEYEKIGDLTNANYFFGEARDQLSSLFSINLISFQSTNKSYDSRKKISDLLILNAPIWIRRGDNQIARDSLLLSLRLNPIYSCRTWTFKFLLQTFFPACLKNTKRQ